MNQEQKLRFEQWLVKQPYSVQKLAKKYPPGAYIIKPNCPYPICSDGTIVFIRADENEITYRSDGFVEVIITPDCKQTEALEFEAMQGAKMGYTKKQIRQLHQTPAAFYIDPIWLSRLPIV
jgi:hypothetical protein